MHYHKHMSLRTYLKDNKISQRKFSVSLGIHYMHLNNILRSERKPSAALALRIEQATGGAVSRMELLYPKKKETAGGVDRP